MEFSSTELGLLSSFRNRVSDVVPTEKLQDDHFLIRWLRARDLDLEKAECMLRKSVEAFACYEMDTILDWQPEVNKFRFAMAGHDADGCPVFIFPVGLWKIHEITEKNDLQVTHRTCLRIMSRIEMELKLSSERFGKPITQFIAIADYQQLAYLRCLNNRNLVRVAHEVNNFFEANFPETLKCYIAINTARFFPLLFKLAQPFLSARTLSNIEIYGNQRRKWITALGKKIPLEILPPYYGGTRPGIDDYCSDDTTLWNDGDSLPDNFYGVGINQQRRKSSIIDLDVKLEDDADEDSCICNWDCEEIKAGAKLDLEMVVSMEVCTSSARFINWWIKSEDYDIGMKVTFKAEGESVQQDIVDYGRIDSHEHLHTGSLLCETPGTYTIVLDNSYSKRRNKMVSYKVYLSENEGDINIEGDIDEL